MKNHDIGIGALYAQLESEKVDLLMEQAAAWFKNYMDNKTR